MELILNSQKTPPTRSFGMSYVSAGISHGFAIKTIHFVICCHHKLMICHVAWRLLLRGYHPGSAGPHLNIKTVFPRMGDSMMEIRRLWHYLIFLFFLNGTLHTGKLTSLNWDGLHISLWIWLSPFSLALPFPFSGSTIWCGCVYVQQILLLTSIKIEIVLLLADTS